MDTTTGAITYLAVIDGQVTQVSGVLGSYLMPGVSLATISATDPKSVLARFDLEAVDYGRVERGAPVTINLANNAQVQGSVADVTVTTKDGRAITQVRVESEGLTDPRHEALTRSGSPVQAVMSLRDGLDLAEEGFGFGVPVVVTTGQTIMGSNDPALDLVLPQRPSWQVSAYDEASVTVTDTVSAGAVTIAQGSPYVWFTAGEETTLSAAGAGWRAEGDMWRTTLGNDEYALVGEGLEVSGHDVTVPAGAVRGHGACVDRAPVRGARRARPVGSGGRGARGAVHPAGRRHRRVAGVRPLPGAPDVRRVRVALVGVGHQPVRRRQQPGVEFGGGQRVGRPHPVGPGARQPPLADHARWMHALEAQAARAYWTDFDRADPVYEGLAHTILPLNFGGKRDYATWFSAEPAAALAILIIPASPSSDHLAGDSERIRANVAEATATRGFDQQYGDYLLMYLLAFLMSAAS